MVAFLKMTDPFVSRVRKAAVRSDIGRGRVLSVVLLVSIAGTIGYMAVTALLAYYRLIPIHAGLCTVFTGLLIAQRCGVGVERLTRFMSVTALTALLLISLAAKTPVSTLPWWGTFPVALTLLIRNRREVIAWLAALVVVFIPIAILSSKAHPEFRDLGITLAMVPIVYGALAGAWALTHATVEGHYDAARSELEAVRGLLSMCARCRKIRGENGEWHELESYVRENSHVRFSHGMCPSCHEEFYGEPYPTDAEDLPD